MMTGPALEPIPIKSPSLIKAVKNSVTILCQKKRQRKILLTLLSNYTMRKNLFILVAICFTYLFSNSQEIQAKLTVNVDKDKIPSTVDRKIFQTLQSGLTNFINNRKWTSDAFQTTEKIQVSFLLNVTA